MGCGRGLSRSGKLIITLIPILLFSNACIPFNSFTLADADNGIFHYSGEPRTVDTIMVLQTDAVAAAKYFQAMEARTSAGQQPTEEELDRLHSRMYRVVWLARAKKMQSWSDQKVQYGVPPAGFQQMIPENGPAPRLVEGDHYGIVAGLYEARNFTPEKCTISSLPPQYVIHGSFVIRHGRFALGVARFRLEDPEGGIFAYSGESIDVDTIMVEEVAPLSAGGIRARLASQRELPGASAQPVVNRAFRVLWLVRAKEIQAWSNSKVQYGVPPPGFAQIIPANTPAPKLLEGHNYWISAGAYGARDFNAETVTVTPGVYPIQQVFTLRHGRFHVSPAKEK